MILCFDSPPTKYSSNFLYFFAILTTSGVPAKNKRSGFISNFLYCLKKLSRIGLIVLGDKR